MDGRLPEHLEREPTCTPVDGSVDDDWARELAKHLAPGAQPMAAVTVQTMFGPYHLDVLVGLGPLRVGFSREGGASRPAFDGLWRDAALIGSGGASVIYRLRSVDILHHLEDCLYVVCRSDPRLFSQRGRTNIDRLASDAIHGCRLPREELVVYYPKLLEEDLDADPSGDPEDVIVEPRPRETEGSLHVIRRDRPLLRRWYEYARRSGTRTVEQVMQRFAAEQLGEPDVDP